MAIPSETGTDPQTIQQSQARKRKSPRPFSSDGSIKKHTGSTAPPGGADGGLRDEIETWVNEGGAGDDVKQ